MHMKKPFAHISGDNYSYDKYNATKKAKSSNTSQLEIKFATSEGIVVQFSDYQCVNLHTR